MTTTPIYKKVGRRYVEIGSCDNEYIFYPHGAHLVLSQPGSVLTRFRIEPADAALLAAGERVGDAMIDAMRKASYFRPQREEQMTEKQRKAWEAYKAIAGERSSLTLQGASLRDIVDAGIAVLIEAARKNS